MTSTGPDYTQCKRNAEQLLRSAQKWVDGHENNIPLTGHERLCRQQADLSEAQVWATLALAEATRRNTPINPVI